MSGESGPLHLEVSNLVSFETVLPVKGEGRGVGVPYPWCRYKDVQIEVHHSLHYAFMQLGEITIPLKLNRAPLKDLQ